MKAFIYPSGVTIEPLGDPASASRILNEPLARQLDRVLARCGLEPVRIADRSQASGDRFVLLPDNLYVTGLLLHEFLKLAARETGTVALALADSAFTRFTTPLQELRTTGEGSKRTWIYPLLRVEGARDPADLDGSRARALIVPARAWNVAVWRAQDLPDRPKQHMPVTLHQAIVLESWYHVWAANVLGLPVWGIRQFLHPRRASWLLLKLVWSLVTYLPSHLALALAGFPVTFGAASLMRHVGRALVIRGKRCRIHPTAEVMACELGDDVEIGAFSSVILSVLGDRVTVDTWGEVLSSVAGEDTHFIHRPAFNAAVCYPGCRISLVQASLLGRNASFGGEVRAYDLNLKGPVTIEHRGRIQATGTSGLGTCVGHDAQLWGRISLAPGRAVPNGTMIIEDPHVVLQRIPKDVEPGVIHAIRNGVLVPVGSPREHTDTDTTPVAGS